MIHEDPHPRLGPPDWLPVYTTIPARSGPLDPEAVEWLRSRPDSVKAVLRRLPPACVVMLPCGCRGILASVFEDGRISVRPTPWTKDRYEVPANVAATLEPEGFWAGQDVEWVKKILDGP